MFKNKRPNFLIVIVDEMRYPPVYENKEIKQWRDQNLKSQKILKKYATEFKRHYVGSTACSPSRTTLFTGEYPSLHGVSQTAGIAKSSFDADVFWLDKNTVPTLGKYLEKSNYKTFYKGKWHVSEADIIIPGTTKSLDSFDPVSGIPNKEYTNIYLNSNRLKDYGFNGWIGPEPHGGNPNDSGSSSHGKGRDIVFTNQVVTLLKQLDKCNDNKPWFVVASFVNPHDIALFGDYTENNPAYNFEIDPSVPFIPDAPTENENLSTKPSAQQSYKNIYPQALQPITNKEKYRKLYYSLEKHVDQQIYKILKTLMSSPMYKDTIIIFTSDHGEQLGAHGLHQKWHNMYEESIHIPLIFHSPVLFSGYSSTKKLSNHVDLVPTILALAQVDINKIQNKLKCDHTEVHPFVGKKLYFPKINSYQINYKCDNLKESETLYFLTEDEPTKGLHQVNKITGKYYESVIEPNNIEAIITYLSVENNPMRHLYKYARYFSPNSDKQEYEIYDLSLDPYETKNLADPIHAVPQIDLIIKKLEIILMEQRKKKKLAPYTDVPII